MGWREANEASSRSRGAQAAWRKAVAKGDVPVTDLLRERPECYADWSLLELVRMGKRWGRLRVARLNQMAVDDGINLASILGRATPVTVEWLIAHIERNAAYVVPTRQKPAPQPEPEPEAEPEPIVVAVPASSEPSIEVLPVKPFADWLGHLVQRLGSTDACVATGMRWDTLRDIRDCKRPTVRLTTVDNALLHTDTDLRDLYPELYDFEDEAVVV